MKKLIFLAAFAPFLSFSQIPGENFYGTDQVVRVDITFNQTGFWDSLVANYPLEEDMMAAGFQITDNQGVHEMDSIAIRLKGNSSYGHPGNKKSFKVDINQWVQGQDYDGLKKLNFNNGFKDPTFMREKVFFDLCRTLGIPAPRINYANVYMNGTFWGFYTIVEQVDDQFLDWAILDDLGNLYKAGDNTGGTTPADLMYYGQTATSYYTRYELKTNEDLNDWSGLISLINFINNSSAADFGNNFGTNINQTTFIHSIALDNLFSNLDSYLNSGRNYYLYQNLTTGKWEWIKWDGNEAFGMYSGPGLGNLVQLAPNYVGSNRPLVSRMFANTALYEEYTDYMCEILNSHFNSTYINARADALKALIQPHVTADNNKMYTTQNFIDNVENSIVVSGGMGNQTIYGIKSFVSARNAYLMNALGCEVGLDEQDNEGLKIYPNPFENSFTLKAGAEEIRLFDISGKAVDFEVKDLGSAKEITVNGASGFYLLKFKLNGKEMNLQLVKE
ncbi:MAG: hypothetical protein K0R65_2693 [Crocinitomicaceae bacterium]|jgi:spore coat protein CotH|nr:hypothetical protein [Crocinitomicaceae bacterium]